MTDKRFLRINKRAIFKQAYIIIAVIFTGESMIKERKKESKIQRQDSHLIFGSFPIEKLQKESEDA